MTVSRRLALLGGLGLLPFAAKKAVAQNPVCSFTPAPGTSNSLCASTAFVSQAGITIGNTVTGGTDEGVLYIDSAGKLASTGAGTQDYLFTGNGNSSPPSFTGYNQGGTNALTRTWKSRLQDFVMLDDYAVGDGTTDDTTALANAISAVASGGTIFCSAKSYLLSSVTTVTKPFNLIGAGSGSGYANPRNSQDLPGGTVFLVSSAFGSNPVFKIAPASDTLFGSFNWRDFSIAPQGGYSGGTDGTNTLVYGLYGILIDTTVTNARSQSVLDAVFERLNIAVTSHAIKCDNTSGASTGGTVRCTFRDNMLHGGISMINVGDSNRIIDNKIHNNVTGNAPVSASLVSGAANLTIQGNNITNGDIGSGLTATAPMMQVTAAARVIIRDNWLELKINSAQPLMLLDSSVISASVFHNIFHDDGVGGSTPDLLKLGTVTKAAIDANEFEPSTSRNSINITASASSTWIGGGNHFTATGTTSTNTGPGVTNSGTNTNDARIPYWQNAVSTFANLPGSPVAGQIAIITDGVSAWNATAAGGGTLTQPVYYTGTAWKVLGIPPVTTVANLPASPTAGALATVSDGAASIAWGTAISAGGSQKYLVFYNGTNWHVIGT